MATTVGSGDPQTVKSDTKKDSTDHVSENISSEGDTLVEQHNSQLDSTLQNGERNLYNFYFEATIICGYKF